METPLVVEAKMVQQLSFCVRKAISSEFPEPTNLNTSGAPVGGSLSEKLFGQDLIGISQVPNYCPRWIRMGTQDMPRCD